MKPYDVTEWFSVRILNIWGPTTESLWHTILQSEWVPMMSQVTSQFSTHAAFTKMMQKSQHLAVPMRPKVSDILWSKIGWSTQSKAADRSRRTIKVYSDILLPIARSISFLTCHLRHFLCCNFQNLHVLIGIDKGCEVRNDITNLTWLLNIS